MFINKLTISDSSKGTNVLCSLSGDKSQDEKLLQPYSHILQVPGKQIRSKIIQAFNIWLKIPDDKLHVVDDIVKIIHNSSLLIDDIQDNSILRRGIPAAHSLYGVASTINAVNYVVFIALERIYSLGHSDAIKVFIEELLELNRGQGMELYWRDNITCPSEEEYKQMTIKKTGALFMLAIRLMQVFSENKSDFAKLIKILGFYFQVRDDYCNLCKHEYSENKSYCEDLTEGKFSFPIIHAINNHPNDGQIMQILRQRTRDIEIKKYCISLLEKYGSLKYTRDTLRILDQQMREEVQRLGGNPCLEKILNDLLNWKDE